jgi:hypothetical protein
MSEASTIQKLLHRIAELEGAQQYVIFNPAAIPTGHVHNGRILRNKAYRLRDGRIRMENGAMLRPQLEHIQNKTEQPLWLRIEAPDTFEEGNQK